MGAGRFSCYHRLNQFFLLLINLVVGYVYLVSEILKKIVNSCIYLPELKKSIYLPELILELLKIPGLVYRILN